MRVLSCFFFFCVGMVAIVEAQRGVVLQEPFSARYAHVFKGLNEYPQLQAKFQHALGWKVGQGKRPQGAAKAYSDLLRDISALDLPLVRSVAESLVKEVADRERTLKIAKVAGIGAAAVAAVGVAAHHAHKQNEAVQALFTAVQMAQKSATSAASFFGNKFANLLRLKEVGKGVVHGKWRFAVPNFVGLSSDDVKWFLKKFLLIPLDKRWGSISKVSPHDMVKQARLLADEIEQSFAARKELLERKTCVELFPFSGGSLQAFLQDCALKSDQRLMVRSSGKEDSAAFANAGGNASVVNVACTVKAVLESLIKVVVSYLGETSLMQRISALQDISEMPFVPVLIQVMVGDFDGGMRSRGGVMYTEEPAGGGLSGKTTDITLIQAAYGHNDLVINSEGPCDTFFVDTHDKVAAIICRKPFRLAPSSDGASLARVQNEGDYPDQSALSPAMLQMLKILARTVEKSCSGRPQDIEFTFVLDSGASDAGVLYGLQMRPLVCKHHVEKPSYIAATAQRDKTKIEGVVIGAAGSFVRTIISSEEVICGQTLHAAYFGDFLGESGLVSERREKVKAFFVREMAAATSHEANGAAAHGIPVMSLGDHYDSVVSALKTISKGSPLFFDPQQQFLLLGVSSLKKKDLLDGWARYPLPARESISSILDEEQANTLIADFDNTFFVPTDGARGDGATKSLFLRALCQELKGAGSKGEIQSLVAAIWRDVHKVFNGTLATLPEALRGSYRARARNLLVALGRILKGCLAEDFIGSGSGSIDYLARRLYPLHRLDILLFQQVKGDACLYADSVTTWLREARAAREALRADNSMENGEQQAVLVQFGEYIVKKEVREKWMAFVRNNFGPAAREAGVLPETMRQFVELFRLLDAFNLFPVWLNACFPQHPSSLAALVEAAAREESFLRALAEKKRVLKAVNMNAFSEPGTFLKAWKSLQELKQYFVSKDFLGLVRDAVRERQSLSVGAAANLMATFVDAFDLAIKAVTGSFHFIVINRESALLDLTEAARQKDKLSVFSFMVEEYRSVLDCWRHLLEDWKAKSAQDKRLFKELTFTLVRSLGEVMAQARAGSQDRHLLSIGACRASNWQLPVIENKDARDLDAPRTYEAVFTVVHSALKYIAASLASVVASAEALPRHLEEFCRVLLPAKELGGGRTFAPLPPLITFSNKTCELELSIPAREHSASLVAVEKEGVVDLVYSFRGNNETSNHFVTDCRWHEMLLFVEFCRTARGDTHNFIKESGIDEDEKHFYVRCVGGDGTFHLMRRFFEVLAVLSYSEFSAAAPFPLADDFLQFYYWAFNLELERYEAFFYTKTEWKKYVTVNEGISLPYYFNGKSFADVDQKGCFSIACYERLREFSRAVFSKETNWADCVDLVRNHPECLMWSELKSFEVAQAMQRRGLLPLAAGAFQDKCADLFVDGVLAWAGKAEFGVLTLTSAGVGSWMGLSPGSLEGVKKWCTEALSAIGGNDRMRRLFSEVTFCEQGLFSAVVPTRQARLADEELDKKTADVGKLLKNFITMLERDKKGTAAEEKPLFD